MFKKVGIHAAGSNPAIRKGLVVTPETTAIELLTRAELPGFELCASADELPFGDNEQIYESVNHDSLLFAFREAKAGVHA